jgi:hypothetical protein
MTSPLRLLAWWYQPHLSAIGRPYRDDNGQWTQVYRVHPWRPSFWRSVWRQDASVLSKFTYLVRACWRYRR